MDGDALRQAVETAGPVALAISFAAGLAFSFNPVALAAIPVSLAYVTSAQGRAGSDTGNGIRHRHAGDPCTPRRLRRLWR